MTEMTSDQVLERVKRIVVEDLDVNLRYEDLDTTIPLFEEGLGLDSVILVELISFIEKRFGIELQDEAFKTETFKNLESVARTIAKQLEERQA